MRTLLLLAVPSFAVVVACASTTPPDPTTAAASTAVPAGPSTDMPATPAAPVDTASPTASAAPTASAPTATDVDPLVGKAAPDFTKKTFDGKEVHLAALKGKQVVVYFYPKDETPGCTKEACSFRDAWKDLSATGVTLIGVSMDDAASHKKFAEHWKLPFLLVTDADGAIAKSFGVPVTDGYTARQTFVIGADGNVKKVYRKVSVGGHAAEIMADVKSP